MKELADIDWADAISRMHPALLHLPIGLIVALIWLQLISVFKGLREGAKGARTGLVTLLMITTPAAAASGWLLNEGAKYPDPITLHKWSGVGLAVLSWLLGWAHFAKSWTYTPFLWISALVLGFTAHNGGTLTHGEGFLTDPWIKEEVKEAPAKPSVPAVQAEPAEATPPETEPALVDEPLETASADRVPFDDAMDVLDGYCLRCHGERKQRGGLALHTMEAILAGGDSGPAVVFGDLAASPMVSLLRLPLDHDDHMPPAKKAQPEEEEIALLERWVLTTPAPASGGSLPATPIEDPAPAVEEVEEPSTTPAENPPTTPPASDGTPSPEEGSGGQAQSEGNAGGDASYFTSLANRQIHAQTLGPNSTALWIDLSSTTVQPGELPELLGPVSTNLADLGLARHRPSEADLAFLGGLPKLSRLDLRGLKPQGEEQLAYDLTPLAASASLEVLNLAGTPLTEGSLDVLAGLENLQRVSLAGTGLEGQAQALRERRPGLVVNLGTEPREALEVEPEVKFERLDESR